MQEQIRQDSDRKAAILHKKTIERVALLKEKERMKQLDEERVQEELRQREEVESAKMGARLEKFKELKHRTMTRMQAATRRAKEEEEQQVIYLRLLI